MVSGLQRRVREEKPGPVADWGGVGALGTEAPPFQVS